MSDVVPVARGSTSIGNVENHHDHVPPNRLYANPTSYHRPCEQSTGNNGTLERRQGEKSQHRGNRESPPPALGPGSGARGSPGGGVEGFGHDRRGVASQDGANQRSANRANGIGGPLAEDGKKTQFYLSESVKGDLQTVPVKQKDLLKVVDRVHRHLSDSSYSSSSDSCECSCKLELKELYKENSSLRLRVRAIDAISELLKKTKKELEAEKAKSAKLDIAVSNLQSRLYKFGCDSSVDLPREDIFIPGCDRTFVNSLISENGKLLKELNELKKRVEVETTTTKSEPTSNPEQQLREAKEQLANKDRQISELQALVRSSDDVKTAKIVHLEDACLHKQKELQDVEEMCKVFTAETKKLQADLAETQRQLENSHKELADWKEIAQNFDTKAMNVSMQKMAVHKESNLSQADQLKIAEGQVEQLDKERSRLSDQLREVIGMNTRWQRYNEQRETHVLKLTKTNQHQQSKITVLEQQKRDLEQTINGLNAMLQKLKEEQRKNTDVAILALEHQLASREDRISELAEELSALKMYIQNSQDPKQTSQRPEDRERIQLLEQQVKTYRDDFQQERRDRERVQSNIEILKHQLQDATKKLASFEQQNARMTPHFTAKLAGSAPAYQQPRRLVGRGISRPTYGWDEDLETDAHDEIDGSNPNTEPLQCPSCAQQFSVENHSTFMRHVGICLDQ